MEVACPICACLASLTMNVHPDFGFVDIVKHCRVAKNVYCELVIQQHPTFFDESIPLTFSNVRADGAFHHFLDYGYGADGRGSSPHFAIFYLHSRLFL